MKAIRIFLLVLIIIGLILLATYKLWVPKVVTAILQSEGAQIQAISSQEDGHLTPSYIPKGWKEDSSGLNSDALAIRITSPDFTLQSPTQPDPDCTDGSEGCAVNAQEATLVKGAVFQIQDESGSCAGGTPANLMAQDTARLNSSDPKPKLITLAGLQGVLLSSQTSSRTESPVTIHAYDIAVFTGEATCQYIDAQYVVSSQINYVTEFTKFLDGMQFAPFTD